MRSRSYVFLLTLLISLAIASQANAQWGLLRNFGTPVTAIHFNYKFQPPTNGFVGLQDGKIWFTNNNGLGWTEATTPSNAKITSFAFKDNNVGWASFKSASGSGLLKTTTGGVIWTLLPDAPSDGNIVYYNASMNRLFFGSNASDFSVSIDEGDTWAPIGSGIKDVTGIDFSNGQLGVATRSGSNGLLRTTDGGQTWNATTFTDDSWQPLGIAGTSTFFVSGTNPATVSRSTDGGATWAARGVLDTKNPLTPTGDIKGDRCNLFAQELDGLYHSTNQGQTWALFGGNPPGNLSLTRFSLATTGIMAADKNGGLWTHTFTFPAFDVAFPLQNYKVGASSCNPLDTFIVVRACDCEPGIVLKEVEFTGTGASKYSLGTDITLPAEVCDSTAIPIHYTSLTNSFDTSRVFFRFETNETVPQKLEKYTNFFGHVDPLGLSPSDPAVSLKVPETCVTWDTTIILKMNACEDVRITSLRIDDSSTFRIDRDFMQHQTGPQGTFEIHIFANPSKQGLDEAEITVEFASGEVTQTLKIPLQVNALKAVRPTIQGFTMTVPNGCALRDTVVVIRNTMCDTLRITTLDFFGDTSAFGFEKPTLPLRIAPGDSIVLNFRSKRVYKRGTIFANFKYEWTTSGEQTLQQIALNTVIQNDLPLTIQRAPNTFSFGSVSLCGSRSLWMKFTNTLCSDIEIIDAKLASGPSEFVVGDVPDFPVKLVQGQTDSVRLDFIPTEGGNKTATVTLTLRRDGVTEVVTINVTGNAVTTANTTVSEPLLAYDTTNICSPVDEFEVQSTYIRNESCDSVQVTQFTNLSGDDFTLLEPPVPFWIKKGDSVQVKVILRPKKGGVAAGEFDIRVAPKGGAEVALKLNTTGFVRPAERNIAFTAPRIDILDSLAACQTKDTTITLTNQGLCDTMVIDDILTNGSNAFSIQNKPASFPVRLAPGESLTITLRINPGSNNPPVLDGNIVFESNPDTAIPLHILAKICGGSTQILSLDNADTVFNALRCQKLTKTFTVVSTGTGTTQINNVTLASGTSSTRWRIVSPTNFPVDVQPGQSVTITIEFDPDGTGDTTAQLTIVSNGANFQRTLSLSGSDDALHPTVRLGLRLANNQQTANVNIEEPVTLSVVALDEIDGSLGVNSAALTLNYNGDVLHLPSVTALNGWTLANNGGGNDNMNLVFNHAVSTIPANTVIAEVKFMTILSDSTSSIVSLNQTRFNDENFNRCIASAVSAEDTLTINVDVHCTDNVLLRQLRGATFNVDNLVIRPNPMGGVASGEVSFDLLKDAHVKIDLIDPLGRLANQVLDRDLKKGPHTVPVSVQTNTEGWYMMTISSEGVQVSRKILVKR